MQPPHGKVQPSGETLMTKRAQSRMLSWRGQARVDESAGGKSE